MRKKIECIKDLQNDDKLYLKSHQVIKLKDIKIKYNKLETKMFGIYTTISEDAIDWENTDIHNREQNPKKTMLKDGDILTLRNGEIYMYFKKLDIMLYPNTPYIVYSLSNYNEDLLIYELSGREFDVMKITRNDIIISERNEEKVEKLSDLEFKYGEYEDLTGFWVEIVDTKTKMIINGAHFKTKQDVFGFYLRSKKYFGKRLKGDVKV